VNDGVPRRQAAPRTALAHGAFLALWLAATTSYVGTFVQDIAERWLILELTGTPLPSAMLSTTVVTASLVGMLPAGILADRIEDRRKLVVGSQIAMAIPAAVVALLAATHRVTPAVLLVAAAFLGLGMSLGGPAWYALLSDLLPRELVADAVALNAVSYNIARAIGPAIGGVVLDGAGAPASFASNAASFLVVVLAAVAIRVPARRRRDAPPNLRAAVREPLALLARDLRVRSVTIGMTLFTAGASVVYALAPAYGKITLQATAREYGVVIGAMGTGAVLGAWLLRRLRGRVPPRLLVAAAMATFGVCAVALSRVGSVGAAIVIFVPAGVGWIGSFSSLAALVQVWTPDAIRARMIAVYSMVHLGVWAVGATVGGAIADHASVRAAMLAGGFVCVAAGAVTSRLTLPDSFAGLPASLPPPPPDLEGPASAR
jgi:MFS family permease